MTLNTPTPETSLVPSPQECWDRNKVILLEALKAAGAVRAMVGYSGGGDEGFANEVGAFGADNLSIDLSRTVAVFVEHSRYADGQWQYFVVHEERALEEALSDFAMEAVNDHHRGWENNDGGAGEVIFECADDCVRIEHNDYYTESEYTETTL